LQAEQADILEERVREWLEEEIAVPNAALGRAGPICPFVSPALRTGAVRFKTIPTTPLPTLDVLLKAALEAIRDFQKLDWAEAPTQLQCLVLAFPALDRQAGHLLDDVHSQLKDDVVAHGLMFAQFHPRCTEPSVRSPELNVGRGPVPILVFRRLAVHDILFLEDRASWFAMYHETYGHRFNATPAPDSAVVAAYVRASARFSGIA
jgi:hypothetical protein